MIEVTGNLWDYPADARVITTNGTVKKDGSAVMGKGCAAEAKFMFPGFDRELGRLLTYHGNHVFQIMVANSRHNINYGPLFTFPVKHQWDESAQYNLIERSAQELVAVVTALDIHAVVMPRPGCGNGRLNWLPQNGQLLGVKDILEQWLDNRFLVITFPE